MTKVTGTSITLTRGDSLQLSVSIIKDGEAYVPAGQDIITFFMKRKIMNPKGTEYIDARPIITKEIPPATMVLLLEPADTKHLGFGSYVYDIQIEFANGITDTFINNADFTLAPEVG